ncbi:hypothetical protein SODALDRAFT_324795 [Sodiomyces alkalinus F11]|uniref:N-acetyltransferase domain-containing protein n=1 Tax=Sodiomyces alkalinus (strain CBS 110278 / VKM F-3762 / F11) TaxID=1314773 RepID=A0A3N2PRT8_SODAK|nr:hypothetical protein SODALDRAFT_324795 [Sodiomyces alkalinus F11]ROT37144.1 hypothetical protein SODALDRAFT_324795 [Sodiomyces alkalinus F11]
MGDTTWTAYVKRGPITPTVLHEIYASDQAMYPAPLAFERLRDWVDVAGTDFSFAVYSDADQTDGEGVLIGAVIALPLRKTSWDALVMGELKETSVIASRDLWTPADSEARLGVHVFHVEVYRDSVAGRQVRGFVRRAVDEIVETFKARGVVMEGLSALTATDQGRRCFLNLGFEPTGYEEVWVRRSPDGPTELVVFRHGGDEQDQTRTRPGEVLGRAQMMVKKTR